jgi:altered-inheritance-of-mitochondria protein 5
MSTPANTIRNHSLRLLPKQQLTRYPPGYQRRACASVFRAIGHRRNRSPPQNLLSQRDHGHDNRLRKHRVTFICILCLLTSAILYLSISLHAQNRATQAALLRQQRNVLTGFYEPKEPEKEPRAREVPIGLAEMAKDRWNRVLEETVQTAYNTDWRRVRESAEDRLSTVAQKIRESGK